MISISHGSTLCSSLTWARSCNHRMNFEGVFQESEHMVRISATINNVVLVPRKFPQHYSAKAWLSFQLLQEERLYFNLVEIIVVADIKKSLLRDFTEGI